MAWWDTDWSSRVKVTTNSASHEATETDFPLPLDLSILPSSFFSTVNSDGSDIRVTRGEDTQIARHVGGIDTGSETGSIHFAPGVDVSGSDTDFHVYYGNDEVSEPAPGSTYGSEAVYDGDTVMAHSFGEASGNAIDGTANDNDGTVNGASYGAPGRVGSALSYDGDDWTAFGDAYSQATFSMMVWAKVDAGAFDAFRHIYSAAGGTTDDFVFLLRTEADNKVHAYLKESNEAVNELVGPVLSTDTWFHVAVRRNNQNGDYELFVDGQLEDSTTNAFGWSNTRGDPSAWSVGRNEANNSSYWKGEVDQLHHSSVYRLPRWIRTMHAIESDMAGYWTVAQPEDFAAEPPVGEPNVATTRVAGVTKATTRVAGVTGATSRVAGVTEAVNRDT